MTPTMRGAKALDVSVHLVCGSKGFDKFTPGLNGERWNVSIDIEKKSILHWRADRLTELLVCADMEKSACLLHARANFGLSIYSASRHELMPSSLLPYLGFYGSNIHLIIDPRGKIKNWHKKPTLEDYYELPK